MLSWQLLTRLQMEGPLAQAWTVLKQALLLRQRQRLRCTRLAAADGAADCAADASGEARRVRQRLCKVQQGSC